MPFDYDLDFDNLDFRKQPELYRVGRGEQGVLLVEPYKGEILPHWRFKTPDIAKESSEKIMELFEEYRKQDDFVGWIWRVNLSKWAIHVHVDTPIIRVVGNTMRTDLLKNET